jgi:hypothetical protein
VRGCQFKPDRAIRVLYRSLRPTACRDFCSKGLRASQEYFRTAAELPHGEDMAGTGQSMWCASRRTVFLAKTIIYHAAPVRVRTELFCLTSSAIAFRTGCIRTRAPTQEVCGVQTLDAAGADLSRYQGAKTILPLFWASHSSGRGAQRAMLAHNPRPLHANRTSGIVP